MRKLLKDIKPVHCVISVLGAVFLAFGMYNIHSLSGVTEGGVLGLNLLARHWLGISPAVTNFLVSALCYLLGWRLLGRTFIIYSAISAASFSAAYATFERFDPLWPGIAEMPLLAALIGALFVGIGTGACVRAGGAVCGDDALAMALSHLTGLNIQWIYLITDLAVLGLSITYIPLGRIAYSLLTVLISGQIIGLIQRIKFKKQKTEEDEENIKKTA